MYIYSLLPNKYAYTVQILHVYTHLLARNFRKKTDLFPNISRIKVQSMSTYFGK